MVYDVVQEERRAFSERLLEALTQAGFRDSGATEIARLFNYHCSPKVSSYAVHKWLSGAALPTQQRMICLANWLRCDSGWLRYGTGDGIVTDIALTSNPDAILLRDLVLLDDKSKELVRVLVASMLDKQ